ncbi:hypothetical protein GQ457_15G014100 [Hibiscus cannabinus]
MVRKRLDTWSARALSFAGRVTLAKSVLQAISSYTMQVTWLQGIYLEREKMICSFVWGASDTRRGINLVSWDEMQQPLDSRGLGFRKLEQVN